MKTKGKKNAIAFLSIATFILLFILGAVSVLARPVIYTDEGGDDTFEVSYVAFPDGRIFLQYISPYPRNLTEDPYPYIPTETPKKPRIILPPSLELEDLEPLSGTPPLRYNRR